MISLMTCLLKVSFAVIFETYFPTLKMITAPAKSDSLQPQIENHWPRLIEGIEDGRAWNKPGKWQPIQVNPSITVQLLRRRTAPRQGSEWFGIEMEEWESYSSWTLPPFLLEKNLDKERPSWFGTEKYLGRKSRIREVGFLNSSHFYLTCWYFHVAQRGPGFKPVPWLQSF